MLSLKELGLIKSESSKVSRIFEEIIPDFFDVKYEKPKDYISFCWNKYESLPRPDENPKNKEQGDKSTIGKFFELCLATLFIRESLVPFYMQANVAFVPGVDYDFIFYTAQRGPICVSAKTSLRERYKQADLEGALLKNVHRRSKTYLITLSDEFKNIKEKINHGDSIGLDDCIKATTDEFDALIKELKTFDLLLAEKVDVIQSSITITNELVNKAIEKR